MTLNARFLLPAVLALAASPLAAQVASSSSFALEGFSLGTAGGGMSGFSHSALVNVMPMTYPEVTSTNFEARVGFFGGADITLGNSTVIWGVTPTRAHRSGGTPFNVHGMNLDAQGPALPVLTMGSTVATGVGVASNTWVTGVTPAGSSGPKDVGYSQGSNTDSLQAGFINTPATIASIEVMRGAPWRLENYGAVGDSFVMLASTTTTMAPTEFGLLLIGPDILFVILSAPYFPPEGFLSLEFIMPNNPNLAGLNVFIQNINVSGGGNTLTNRTTTLIH